MSPLKKMRFVSRSLVTLALACAVGGVQAAPLVLDQVSALDAAHQLSDKYGVNIVFKGDFGPTKYVSFTLSDADASGSRLQAVNALANAVGADFTKTYVISKVGAGQDVPVAKIDSNAPIVFPSVTMSAEQAISAVAAVDSATAQFPGDISGNVTLSATQLSVGTAAQEIAAQTHTRWKVFYAMLPRTNGRQTGGKVIGHTNGGSAITELPFVYYQHIPTPAERQAQQQASTNVQGSQSGTNSGDATDGFSPFGDYFNSYDYGSPFGNSVDSGFQNSGFGNGGFGTGSLGNSGYVDNGSGVILGPGNGFGNGAGDGPIVFQTGGY